MSDKTWSPDSWRQFPAAQQPQYPDGAALERAVGELRNFPPLVSIGEIETLKRRIAQAAKGEAFILHGGDCAERFEDCREGTIANQLKILLQMSVILTYGVRKPVIRIGRMAGQYAKPRSSDYEEVEGRRLLSYRGDGVNAITAEAGARTPDPQRLIASYFHSATTLNFVRAMIDGGFADLHYPYHWNLDSIEKSRNWPEYREVVERILDAIQFMESFGGVKPETLGRVEFYTSHEGLLLGYEEALTRRDEATGRHYNVGAHMLWIGERTRDPAGAHVEHFRGLANPIGVKVGPRYKPEDVARLLEILNPANEEGRVTLITRLGAGRVEEVLPPLAAAVRASGRTVAWSCDPMHGNTRTLPGGRKTREFSVILDELQQTFRVLRECGAPLGGVHFELTGDDVTECVGGAGDLTSDDLARRYETYCDPRLNDSQSLEMAFLIARLLKTT